MSVADRVPAARVTLPVSALVMGVLAWWAAVEAFSIPAFLLPSPVAVAGRLAASPGLFAANALVTFERVIIGGGVGIVAGFCLAVFVSQASWLRRAVVPYLVTLRVLPTISVAPLLLIYYGTGFTTGVIFVALITFFPMVVNTTAGLTSVPAHHLDLLESVGASWWKVLVHLRLPHAVPDVFAGLKQSATLAVVGAVVAEWVVATNGLGTVILLASEQVQPAVMLAAVAVLFVEGLALYGVVAFCQRRVVWSERSGASQR